MIIVILLQPHLESTWKWHKACSIYIRAFSLFHLICPCHSVNLCQLVDCQFGDTFLEKSPRVFAAGPLSIAPSNTATNWNVVQFWESSQHLNQTITSALSILPLFSSCRPSYLFNTVSPVVYNRLIYESPLSSLCFSDLQGMNNWLVCARCSPPVRITEKDTGWTPA